MTVQTITPADVPGAALTVAAAAPQSLTRWVEEASAAQSLARTLVRSYFVPQAYKPQIPPRAPADEVADAVEVAIANATGAILLGQSLSTPAYEIDPLTALQNIYVVHGRPGMYAKFKLALAQAHGHRVLDEEYTADAVTVAGWRRGAAPEDVVRIRLTMQDAERAGWTTNKNYEKTPADMLWSRAVSRVLDRIAADVLFGIASLEELYDIVPGEVVSTSNASTSRVTVEQLQAAAQQAAAPAEPTLPIEPAAAVPMIEKSTWTALNAEWTRLGVKGPGAVERRLTGIRRIIDRHVAGGSELTAIEGDLVLDVLRGLDPDQHADRVADILGERVNEPDVDGPAADDVAPPAGPEPKGWDQ